MNLIGDILPQDDIKRMLAQVDRTLAQLEARSAQAESLMESAKQLIDNVNLIVIRLQDFTGAKGSGS